MKLEKFFDIVEALILAGAIIGLYTSVIVGVARFGF